MGINKIILIGKVKEEPVITSGNKLNPRMATLQIITNESVLEDSTQKYQGYEEVKVYGELIDIVENSVTKGTTIYLEGKLKTTVKEIPTRNDRKKYKEETTEVIVSNRTRGKIQVLQDVKNNEIEEGIIPNNSCNEVIMNNEDPGYSEKDYMEFLDKSET